MHTPHMVCTTARTENTIHAYTHRVRAHARVDTHMRTLTHSHPHTHTLCTCRPFTGSCQRVISVDFVAHEEADCNIVLSAALAWPDQARKVRWVYHTASASFPLTTHSFQSWRWVMGRMRVPVDHWLLIAPPSSLACTYEYTDDHQSHPHV